MNAKLDRAREASSKNNIFAVIVNWNRPKLTAECLRSLIQQDMAKPEIILVDNGSTDESVPHLSHAFPQIDILETHENLYYAPAANIGIRKAMSSGPTYILLMNNDAVADQSMLTSLLEQELPETGILAPAVYYYERPDELWSMGGRLQPLLLERSDDTSDLSHDTFAGMDFIEMDFVTGCCMLVPTRIFESIGLLDERFLMYYDDADFCYRVRESGNLIQVVPAAKAWHHVAASSEGSDSPNERYWMARSSVLFFHKHASWPRSAFILIYRAASAIKMIVRLLFMGNMQALLAYVRGLKDGIEISRRFNVGN